MKDTATMLLTLVIMAIGLTLMVGGSGAVRFLFAPILAGLGFVVRAAFVLLIILVILVAVLSGRRTGMSQVHATAAETSEDVSVATAGAESGEEAPSAH